MVSIVGRAELPRKTSGLFPLMVSPSAGKLSMAHEGQSLPMVAPALFASRQNHHYKALSQRVLQSSSFLHPGVAAASLCFFLVPVACLCDLTL